MLEKECKSKQKSCSISEYLEEKLGRSVCQQETDLLALSKQRWTEHICLGTGKGVCDGLL